MRSWYGVRSGVGERVARRHGLARCTIAEWQSRSFMTSSTYPVVKMDHDIVPMLHLPRYASLHILYLIVAVVPVPLVAVAVTCQIQLNFFRSHYLQTPTHPPSPHTTSGGGDHGAGWRSQEKEVRKELLWRQQPRRARSTLTSPTKRSESGATRTLQPRTRIAGARIQPREGRI